ncbi:MAG: UpxY family transcription antiterminator [Bacteroidota bacterium]|nr:UpxY family transcription antiterminator [Bacteroidota bacterium]
MERLETKGIDAYLPLRKELKQWSDRKKWIEMPLFSGYIFTNVFLQDFEKIGFTEGVLTFLRYNGKPAILREEEMDRVKMLLSDPEGVEVFDNSLLPGEAIEIIEGPMRGLHGEIVSFRGRRRFAIRIDALNKIMVVDLPKAFVRKRMVA